MLALDNDLEVEESMTKDEIKDAISDAGIDDDYLQDGSAPEEEISTGPAETEDEVLIRMITGTKYYSYGRYVFTKQDPFAVMKKEDADSILRANGDSFRKASEDEVRKFFV